MTELTIALHSSPARITTTLAARRRDKKRLAGSSLRRRLGLLRPKGGEQDEMETGQGIVHVLCVVTSSESRVP